MTTDYVDPALEVIDMPINMGPQHPSTHGVFRMVLVIDGEKIVDVSRTSATCTGAARS